MELSESINSAIKTEVKRRILDECIPRIGICVGKLTEEQVWWRPNAASNSIGNLILHLCGNARQWIASGVGDAQDIRKRQQEFDEQGPIPRAELLSLLESTAYTIKPIIDGIKPEDLIRLKPVQTFEESVVGILIHVTEHFSYHTGQIAWITKMLTEEQVGFYEGMEL